MATGRSQSDPLVPPAKAHTVPLPPKPQPTTKASPTDPPPTMVEPVAAKPVDAPTKPLEAVDREIADEADRLIDGGAALDSDAQGEYISPAPTEQSDGAGHVGGVVTSPAAESLSPDEAIRETAAELEEARSDAEPPQPPARPEPPAATEPPQPVESQPEVEAQQAEEAASEPAGPSWLSRVPRLAMAAVIAVLVVVNYPVRLLPDSARTFFNWFAISLLLWVPAIWFIALYVI